MVARRPAWAPAPRPAAQRHGWAPEVAIAAGCRDPTHAVSSTRLPHRYLLPPDQNLKKLVILWSKLPVMKQTKLAKYFEKTEQLTAIVKGVTVGPSIKEADLAWRSLNGPFVSVCLGYIPFANEDAMAAPKAKFADGYLDAAIIKDCQRWDVLGLMFQMKDGAYINSPCVEYFKVKAIRIEPASSIQTGRYS